jgi:protein-disulfide isomerase
VIGLIVVGAALRGSESPPERLGQQEGRIFGSVTAPVVLSVWSDFQCPVCKAAAQTVLADIEAEYVEAGLVQIHYRHYAFLGQESVMAAEASECAAEQNHFWEYHDTLFLRQSGENRGAFATSRLKGIASELSLDTESFNQCLDERRYKAVVDAERQEGTRLGVRGTPTLFINGTEVPDWRSYDSIKRMIERALNSGA